MMRLRRLTLTRRADRKTYLDRWGIETRIAGVYLHHIGAPDPGVDLHDHPWWFCSIILRGGYCEIIGEPRACHIDRRFTRWASAWPNLRKRDRWSVASVRLDQAHCIVTVRPGTWTLVIRGPRVRTWGFHTPAGWVRHDQHDESTRELDVDKKAA